MNRICMLVLVLAISLIGVSSRAYATTYYIAASGNDSNNGLTTVSPWRTLAKVKSYHFLAGDVILLKRGDTWGETLTVSSSGVSGLPITFNAYGTGNPPVIDGHNALSYGVMI